MATTLSIGDIAIVQFNSSISTGSADTFSFVFLRSVEAGTTISFTDNGWLAAGGFRPGEGTVTYTAPGAIAAGTVITLTGLDLAIIGDQLIAYQGAPASPTILYLVDFGDGNNTVAGDATNAQTTALPPGLTLGVNAVALAFDQGIYAGPTSGSPAELFATVSNSANWIDSSAPPPLFNPPGQPAIDLDANDSTHGGVDYRAEVISGSAGVKICDTDADITDSDGTVITEIEIAVKSAATGDLLLVSGALPAGIVADSYDPATGTLRLSGAASHADYEAALQLIRFATTGPAGLQKQIEVIVFDGQNWSSEAKAFITITGEDGRSVAAPVLDLDANNSNGGGFDYTATYTAGGPGTSIADVDVTITDPDNTTLASAKITILNWNQPSGDTLSISGPLPAGITASAYDPATLTITLSGVASLADYQTALRQVVFSSTNPAPGTGDRGIQVTVNDGILNSNIATTYMHVASAPPNAAPVLNLDADSSTTGGADYLTTFTGGGAPVAIADTDVLITDADNTTIASAIIQLTSPGANDILLVNGPLPPTIVASSYDSVTGTLLLSGNASFADYQAALRQIAFDDTGTTPLTFTRVVDVTVSDGTTSSNVAHAIIEIEQGNTAAPTLDLDGNNSTAPDTAYRATFTENGSPVPIADIDTIITDDDSTELAFATITLTSREAGDLLSVVGTLPTGVTSSAYDPATGILTLSGNASLADYQTALHAIAFSTAGDNPVPGTRTIDVVVNDGANDSQAATALITVEAVNDAPSLTVAESATYTENSPPLVLSPAVTLTDSDDTDLSLASVRIVGGTFVSGDMLTIGGATSGTVGGITFQWVEATRMLVMTGTGSIADYQSLLQGIQFQSSSDNPTDFNAIPTRLINWTVSDGSTTTNAISQLNVIAVNDAPVVTVAATAAYTENGPPLVLSPAATLSDVDDINLVGGQVRIVTPLAGDTLTVNGLTSGTFAGVDFSFDPTAGRLLFGHPAAVVDFQAFMQAVAFNSASDDPTAGGAIPTRTLSWAVFDGDALSEVQTTIVTITAVNDPPVAQNGSASGAEDTPIDGTLIAADVESESLTYRLDAQAAHGTVVVNQDGSFTYTPNQDFSGTDGFSFIASDGEADSNTATVSLAIAAVNDAPHLDLDADDSTAPLTYFITNFTGSNIPVADADVAITDADGLTLTSAIIRLINPQIGDLLSVDGALGAGIVVSAYDPATGILTLSGEASLVDYQVAIHQVEFGTSSATTTARVVEVTVNDGSLDSNDAVSTINMNLAPEPPEPPATIDPHWMATRGFTPHPEGWSPIIVADLAGDQMSDLLWRSDSTGNLDEWQIVNGGWTRSVDLGGHPGTGWLPTSAGDFNGDDTEDIFWFEPASGNTDIWMMANGEYAASVSPGLHPLGFEVAGTGDFDGDSTDDILWFSAQTGEVDIWKIVNGQWAGSVNPGSAPAGFSIAATGDINHDGSDDVIWFNPSSGNVQVWEMQNGQIAGTIDVGPHPLGYSIVGSADFTGEGTDDILWFNPTTNDVDLWKMQDSHWAGSVGIGLHPPGWQPVGIGDSDGNGIADVWWREGTTTNVEAWMISIH